MPNEYAEWLDWWLEQPCLFCYEDNRHCVCRDLDERFGEDEAYVASHTDPRRI